MGNLGVNWASLLCIVFKQPEKNLFFNVPGHASGDISLQSLCSKVFSLASMWQKAKTKTKTRPSTEKSLLVLLCFFLVWKMSTTSDQTTVLAASTIV